jgi:hypothetical protein
MSKLSKIIESLAAESSTKAKQSILEANRDNETLRELFRATLSPRVSFYLRGNQLDSKSSPFDDVDGGYFLTTEVILNIVDTLDKRKLTGHAARDYVQQLIEDLVVDDRMLVIAMLNRDLNCKVAGGLVNRVWKDLIPEYPCLLADKLTPKRAQELVDADIEEFIVQLKADGGRCNAVIRNRAISFFSRNGNELTLHGVFDDCLSAFNDCMVDGELVIEKAGETQNRQTGNGIYNKAVRGTISKSEAEEFVFYVWDVVPIDKFDAENDPTPYSIRVNNLADLLRKNHSDKVRLIDTVFVKSLEEAQQYGAEQIAKGYEGAIIKLPSLTWSSTRSKDMLKIKEEKSVDLVCVGVQPHSKNPSMIGSLELETADGLLRVSSGSGLTDDDRLKDPDFYIGKIVELKYNAVIKSKGKDTYSLFLPIFKTVRSDKSTADTLASLSTIRKQYGKPKTRRRSSSRSRKTDQRFLC